MKKSTRKTIYMLAGTLLVAGAITTGVVMYVKKKKQSTQAPAADGSFYENATSNVPMYDGKKLLFIDEVKTNKNEFGNAVIKVSQQLGIDPNWLMAAMKLESGINHTAVNPTSNATGLIQFMPSTARSLGTTVESLKQMSNIYQLAYVYKYLKPYQSKIKSFEDLYLAIFFPVAIGKPNNYKLQTASLSASKIARSNPGYDLDKNGIIYKGEIVEALNNKFRAWL